MRMCTLGRAIGSIMYAQDQLLIVAHCRMIISLQAPPGELPSSLQYHSGLSHYPTIYVLLVGGDKSSQAKDISRAKKMARELLE
jgi:hypothetical protein